MNTDFSKQEALVKAIADAEKALENTTAADEAAQSAAQNAVETAKSTAEARSNADAQFHSTAADLYNFLFPPVEPPTPPTPPVA